jgi:hypothetical protein
MILGTSRALRVFAYPEPVDLRKGYDGLFGLVKTGPWSRSAQWRSVPVRGQAAHGLQGFGLGRYLARAIKKIDGVDHFDEEPVEIVAGEETFVELVLSTEEAPPPEMEFFKRVVHFSGEFEVYDHDTGDFDEDVSYDRPGRR